MGPGSSGETPIPTHALLGVGVLAEGHRFFDASDLDKHFAELKTHCRRVEAATPGYHPVADIGNRFYAIPHTAELRLSQDTRAHFVEIQRLVDSVNKLCLTITPDQLRQINSIAIVAGTVAKARALCHFMSVEQFRIEYLCIDAAAAEEILRLP